MQQFKQPYPKLLAYASMPPGEQGQEQSTPPASYGYPPIAPQSQMTPPSGMPPRKHTGRNVGIGCGAVILIAVIILFAAIVNAGNSTSAPTAAATSTTDTSSAAQPTQAPTQAVQPTQAPSKAQLVIAWRDKYGSIIQTLVSDLNAISTDGTNQDVSGMNHDCTTLQTDVATAQSYPAIPDAQTANDWSSGLSYMASAAQDCIDGTANQDASSLRRAITEMNQASAKIQAATNDIKALIGQ